MDKIFSARVDESVIGTINELARKLHLSKKRILEDAVMLYAEKSGEDVNGAIFQRTNGAWKRDDDPREIYKKGKKNFGDSMRRHHS